jgi:hypothetical protein
VVLGNINLVHKKFFYYVTNPELAKAVVEIAKSLWFHDSFKTVDDY